MESLIRFAVVSDCHFHHNGENGWVMAGISSQVFAQALYSITRLEPHFLLLPGDLLYDGERENLCQVKRLLDRLPFPYYVVAGNHDFKTDEWLRQDCSALYISSDEFITAFIGHGYDAEGENCYSKIVPGGVRLIGLDGCHRTQAEGWGGRLDSQQLRWFDDCLAASVEDVIIMIHHGLVHYGQDGETQKGRWYSLDNSEEVRAIINRHAKKVRLIVSGHRHIGLRYQLVEQIPYFTIPSVVSYPMRYAVFSLTANSIDYRSYDVPVAAEFHEEARRHLENKSSLVQGQPADTEMKMQFYDNREQAIGRILR